MSQPSYLIEIFLLLLVLLWESILKLSNILGLAWWARVETIEPHVVYWFGPFLSRKGASKDLNILFLDISREGSKVSNSEILRCCCNEPLTDETSEKKISTSYTKSINKKPKEIYTHIQNKNCDTPIDNINNIDNTFTITKDDHLRESRNKSHEFKFKVISFLISPIIIFLGGITISNLIVNSENINNSKNESQQLQTF